MELLLHYLFFAGFVFWLALEPGPGFAKLSFEVSAFGRRCGIAVAIGMFAGALPVILLLSFGLGSVLQQSVGLTTTLKFVGALYLFWLAFGMVRTRPRPDDPHKQREAISANPQKSAYTSVREGFWLVLLNPRTVLFYPACLPLFVREQASVSIPLQLFLLGLTVCSIFLLVDLLFVFLFNKLKTKSFGNKTITDMIRYLSATLLAGVGIKLLLEKDS